MKNKLYHYFSEKAFIYRFTVIVSVFRFNRLMQKRGVDKQHISYRHYLHAFKLIGCTLGEYADYELFCKSDEEIIASQSSRMSRSVLEWIASRKISS